MMRQSKRFFLGGAALTAIALVSVWNARRPIADNAIRNALDARNVSASYIVRDIGFRTQRLENIVIGDPARPDLTAAWAEVSLAPHWGGVRVTDIRASGVRLRGRIVAGRASWGAVDRLLPAPTGKPFELPAIDADLDDARVMLATDFGELTAVLTGKGPLDDGFTGKARLSAVRLEREGCTIERPTSDVNIAIRARRIGLDGLASGAVRGCGGVKASKIAARFAIKTTEAIDRLDGTVRLDGADVTGGALKADRVFGTARFAGPPDALKGTVSLSSPSLLAGGNRLQEFSYSGSFQAGRRPTLSGQMRIDRALPDPALLASLRESLARSAATPAGPLATKLVQAINGAGAGIGIAATISLADGAVRIANVRGTTRSGALLALDGDGARIDAKGTSVAATLRLSGGNFPSLLGRFMRRADGATDASFDPISYRASNAVLTTAPIRIAMRRDGAAELVTTAQLDGPLGDGRIDRLRIPLTIRRTAGGAVRVVPGCQRASFGRAAFAGTVLQNGSAVLCPTSGDALLTVANGRVSGGAKTGPLRLTGSLGGQPLVVTGRTLAFSIGGPLAASGVSVALGAEQRRTQLQVERIEGRFGSNGMSGKFGGLSGAIARVPLVVDRGTGDWRLARVRLLIDVGMTLSDAATTVRFKPLVADDVKLSLANGRIDATATLREPVSGRVVTRVVLDHDLGQAVGEARLAVDGLMFGKSLQPEAITPLTLGVVADVQGRIDGSGVVRWRGDALTSSGRFRTDALDLAAAFGPVTGIAGEIEFDDLLSLSTPPGQQLRVGTINPGVEVTGGVVTYRLRPNQRVEIEQGRWPFAGGQLLLMPATLDLGRDGARTLTFRIVGLDAAKFIEQLKLENIAATGIFDGALPIVFDSKGGQIVRGRLVARGPGTLAYVGDVSNAQTNTMAKLAFDALKSIRYDVLAIDLDGALDGEIVSRVGFTGVNDAPVAPVGIARSLTGLPFKFNIVVRAPFRGLVNTARTFQDPGLLLNLPIQPAESGKRPRP